MRTSWLETRVYNGKRSIRVAKVRASSSECVCRETKDFLRDLSQQTKETMKKQLTLGWNMEDRCDGCSGHIWQHFHEVAESGSISFPICETLNQSTRCKTSSMVFQREPNDPVWKQDIMGARKRRKSWPRIEKLELNRGESAFTRAKELQRQLEL